MTIDNLRMLLKKCKSLGKNCYATNSSSHKDFILGELTIVQDVREKTMVLFRTSNNTTVVIEEESLLMFDFHY